MEEENEAYADLLESSEGIDKFKYIVIIMIDGCEKPKSVLSLNPVHPNSFKFGKY